MCAETPNEVRVMASMCAVDWVLLDHAADNPVEVGDVVSVDAGGMPIYQVVALASGQVWLGDDRRRSVQVMPLDGFRWKGANRSGGAAA
jgi:hypothetical protein